MHPFSQAEFLLSAALPADLPPVGLPEIAFAGRSNVGKSSAINALTNRKRLAFTSKTPGRTQTINFYALGEHARLADLPGYGYARVPQTMRAQWRTLVDDYLRARPAVGVVLLMDSRHPLTPLDEQLLDWLGDARVLILLSKCDKLPRREQQETLARLEAVVASRGADTEVRLFSSLSRQGVDESRVLLESWLQDAQIKSPR
jgi:GTP-binding protein